MKKYDVIVIGSGCGLQIAQAAAGIKHKIALVERGLMGGTCLNVGCIPSKMLIYPADVVHQIEKSRSLGINASITDVDFAGILSRTRRTVAGYRNKLHRQLHRLPDIDLYETTARFLDDHTVSVDGNHISAPLIFIAAGARPVIPDDVADDDRIITNENLLDMSETPRDLCIIGGGYIACEYAHFFAAMGCDVTIIEMLDSLLAGEEPEIGKVVGKTLGRQVNILTGTRLLSTSKTSEGWELETEKGGKHSKMNTSQILFAIGRKPNTDWLELDKTGIEVDSKGFIKVDSNLKTSVDGVYAVGDINGQQMFRHAANYQAEIAWHNALHAQAGYQHFIPVDYRAMPHAVFTRPQVASVGLTEAQARKNYDVAIGKADYFETAKGEAMLEKEGFAKAVVEKDTERILGFHIAGPYAPILIQEVVNAMTGDGSITSVEKGVHIHPTLSELITFTLSSIK